MKTGNPLRVPEIVLGFLLAVALYSVSYTLSFSTIFSSVEPNHATYNEKAANDTKQASNENAAPRDTPSLLRPTDAVGFYTLVLCLFTLILAGVSMFQGKLLLNANRATQRSSQSEFRAYIRLEVIGGNVQAGQHIGFDLRVINYGRTPAYDFAFASAVVLRPPGWEWPENIIPAAAPSHTIHPGDRSNETALDSDFILSQEGYDRVRLGTSVIYARGTAVYRDEFGADRRTHIALEFSGPECFRRQNPRIAAKGNYAT